MAYDNFNLPKTRLSSIYIDIILQNATNNSNSPTRSIHLSQHPKNMHKNKRFITRFIYTSNTFKIEFLSDVMIMNGMVDMYAKCGRVEKVHKLFDKMYDPKTIYRL